MSLNVDLNELLQQLPDLISWVVPGLLFMFIFQRFKYEERSYRKESISILNAVCISFFIRYAVIIVFSRLSGDWLWGVDGSVWIAIICYYSKQYCKYQRRIGINVKDQLLMTWYQGLPPNKGVCV